MKTPKQTLLSEKEIDLIVKNINREFSTFGGDYVNRDNPISVALSGKSPVFAAGVDVRKVVEYVLSHLDA